MIYLWPCTIDDTQHPNTINIKYIMINENIENKKNTSKMLSLIQYHMQLYNHV